MDEMAIYTEGRDHWLAWLSDHSGGMRPAPTCLGDADHRALEPAPGRYVRI